MEAAKADMKQFMEAEFAAAQEAALGELRAELQAAAAADRGAALEALRTELEASVAEATQACEDLEIRLQGTVSSLESEKGETTRLKGEVKKTQQQSAAQKTELEAAIAGVRGDLAASQQDGKMLEAELQSLKEAQGETEKEIQERISSFTREAESCRMQVAAKAVEIEGVQKVVEEKLGKIADLETQLMDAEQLRRKLHNQIQELKGNVRVFCRVRPEAAGAPLAVDPSEDGISLNVKAKAIGSKEIKDWGFGFDRVFPPAARQDEVFEEVSQLVQSALDGYKVCLFSYGQTGSGKTHTMLGADGDARGIIPRSVEKIVEASSKLKAKRGWEYSMSASYVEIYNEQIRDLLQPGSWHSEKHTIKHNPGGCPVVNGVLCEAVPSVEAAEDLVRRAAAARSIEATQMNAQSSRSHTLFMLYITGVHAGSQQKLEGCLCLVDLAGSERVLRSGAKGDRLKEACAINKSLSCLGDVFQSITAGQKHIPYRNSKLTHLLAPCLGGDGKTLMLANLSGLSDNAEESLCTLRFASKVNACELGTQQGGRGAKRNITSIDPAEAPKPAGKSTLPRVARAAAAGGVKARSPTGRRTTRSRPSTAPIQKGGRTTMRR